MAFAPTVLFINVWNGLHARSVDAPIWHAIQTLLTQLTLAIVTISDDNGEQQRPAPSRTDSIFTFEANSRYIKVHITPKYNTSLHLLRDQSTLARLQIINQIIEHASAMQPPPPPGPPRRDGNRFPEQQQFFGGGGPGPHFESGGRGGFYPPRPRPPPASAFPPPNHPQQPPPSKYTKIARMREQSRQAMIAEQRAKAGLGDGSTVEMAGEQPPSPCDLPITHDAFYTSTATAPPPPELASAMQMDAGDLSVAVETALDACAPRRGRAVASQVGGEFLISR